MLKSDIMVNRPSMNGKYLVEIQFGSSKSRIYQIFEIDLQNDPAIFEGKMTES